MATPTDAMRMHDGRIAVKDRRSLLISHLRLSEVAPLQPVPVRQQPPPRAPLIAVENDVQPVLKNRPSSEHANFSFQQATRVYSPFENGALTMPMQPTSPHAVLWSEVGSKLRDRYRHESTIVCSGSFPAIFQPVVITDQSSKLKRSFG
jgi:hypothetical protein